MAQRAGGAQLGWQPLAVGGQAVQRDRRRQRAAGHQDRAAGGLVGAERPGRERTLQPREQVVAQDGRMCDGAAEGGQEGPTGSHGEAA